jgi:hypothetical protein
MIDFGRRGGIHVLTQDKIEKYLNSLPEGKRAYGQSRLNFYGDFFSKRGKVLKAEKEIALRLFEARNLYLIGSSLTNLNRSIEGLKIAYDCSVHSDDGSDKKLLWFFVACEYISALSLNLLKVAEETFNLSEKDRESLVSKRLTYGDLPEKKVKEIISLSQRLLLESIPKGEVTEDKHFSESFFQPSEINPPDYTSTINGLLKRIIDNPLQYFDGLKALELILFDFIIPQQKLDLKLVPLISENSDIEGALKIAKNFITVACDSANIDKMQFWVRTHKNKCESEEKKESPNVQLSLIEEKT